MDVPAMDRILDLAVRLVRQGHNPYRVAACWPAHELALRQVLPVAQALQRSGGEAAADLRASHERWPPIDWRTVLAEVPQAAPGCAVARRARPAAHRSSEGQAACSARTPLR